MKVKRTQYGNGVSDPIWWEVISDRFLSLSDAINIQDENGYHTGSYGFEEKSFKCTKTQLGDFITTWKCYASCD